MSFLSAGVGNQLYACFLLIAFSSAWPCFLAALATILLISGLDDLVPVVICLRQYLRERKRGQPTLGELLKEERHIAIFVPCWKESAVIGNMVRHNIAAIGYRNFDFFLGVYPNDEETVRAVEELADTFANVHLAACPHDGPTSKADCLNWIYQRMLLFEEQHARRFDTVVLHDAEDLIHPEALPLINQERARYAMVQVPVLPFPTRITEWTHGVYCDEFSEYQTIDMPARQFCGSFIPSSGVGTGFAREILEQLASERGNLVFDPASLTEDYEAGVHIHALGYSQLFALLKLGNKGFTATREYFPRKIASAIRQRTRWVMGIALQCGERNGWRGSWATRYWFWRDRKGLCTNPVSLLTNVVFLVGVEDWFRSLITHRPWAFAVSNPIIIGLCVITLMLQSLRLGIRMHCVGRIFGPAFALGVPLRYLLANFINCIASLAAVGHYANARFHHRPLVWLKTEHAYPSRDALLIHKRELSEVLVASGYFSEQEFIRIQTNLPPETELADFLLENKLISDEDLCRAISLQSGVRAASIDIQEVKTRVVRSLPAHVEKRFRILPIGLRDGHLILAGFRIPPAGAFEELKSFTRLPIDFRLVTARKYNQLRELL